MMFVWLLLLSLATQHQVAATKTVGCQARADARRGCIVAPQMKPTRRPPIDPIFYRSAPVHRRRTLSTSWPDNRRNSPSRPTL